MIDLTITPAVRDSKVSVLRKIYAPRDKRNAWQWAEANMSLTPEESRDHHGPYDSSAMPYARRTMEFLTTPGEKEFIPRKSSQLGMTLAYLLGICFTAAVKPTHVLYAMDSVPEARKISRRLKRLIETNPVMAESFAKEGEDGLQNVLLKLAGMDVWFIGSGAAGGFANKSAGLVILDELDLHEPPPKDRGETIDLGRERLKKVKMGKLIAGGKPEEWHAPTNQNYLTGTREEIFMPCPKCGHSQPIHWSAVRFGHCRNTNGDGWDFAKVLAETFVECENPQCRHHIRDSDKPSMLRGAKCVRTNFGADKHKPFPGRVSLWVNDLISTDPQNSWGNIACRWIDAQDSPSKLRVFFNGVLALPQEEKKTEIDPGDVRALSGEYAHGCMPVPPAENPDSGAVALFLCTDKQATHKRWAKVGFAPNGEMFVVDYGRCLTLDDLQDIAAEPVWIGKDAPLAEEINTVRDEAAQIGVPFHAMLAKRWPDRPFRTIALGIIDEGYSTYIVRDWCHRSLEKPCAFFASKGVESVRSRELVTEISDRFRTTREDDTGPQGSLVTVYHFSDDDIKQELYIGKIAGLPAIKNGKSRVPRMWLPKDPDAEFCGELSAERRVPTMVRGRVRMKWSEPAGCNDGGDAVKLALVLWQVTRFQFGGGAETAGQVVSMGEDGRLTRG